MTTTWTDYHATRPPEAGIYLWRAASQRLSGVTIDFVAAYRLRGAGHENVLSPDFDHWTGYRVIVPQPLQWAHVPAGSKTGDVIAITGMEDRTSCPFCHKVPAVVAAMSQSPLRADEWFLKCCGWVNWTATMCVDPLMMVKAWNARLCMEVGDE